MAELALPGFATGGGIISRSAVLGRRCTEWGMVMVKAVIGFDLRLFAYVSSFFCFFFLLLHVPILI